MSLKEKLKDEGRKEKEKLANMSWRDRVWYIWEYYKIHMLVAAMVFLLLYLILNICYNRTFNTQLSYVVINNTNTEYANFETFNQEFKDYMGFGKKDKVDTDSAVSIRLGEIANEMDYGNMAKISAMAASNSLDMIITDETIIQYYMSLDVFVDLEQFLPDDIWQQVKDTVCYAKNSEGKEIACALDLTSTHLPAQTGVTITPCYLGIVISSNRTDNAISWIRFVLEQP